MVARRSRESIVRIYRSMLQNGDEPTRGWFVGSQFVQPMDSEEWDEALYGS